MSVTADSPLSSSRDDFASFLDAELDAASEGTPEELPETDELLNDVNEANEEADEDLRIKRRRLDESEDISNVPSSSIGGSHIESICPPHPGDMGGMCIRCGQKVDDESGVKVSYIHKSLRLSSDEIARLRSKDSKNLLSRKKLYLVLDLDHTLLNSTRFGDITLEERYLTANPDSLPDAIKGSLFRLDFMYMMTKLRPYVHTFLREANKLFEMYIYTMGERAYALQMAKLLDPGDQYFHSRVIAQGDCTQRHQKGLDVVLGQESAVLILDDTEAVWSKHKDNLILMERYHFFGASCKQFGFNSKSLSEQKTDESEDDGALSTILKILQRVHSLYFDQEHKDDMLNQDVRKVLKAVRKEVLKGCKIVFSRIFPTKFQAENHHLWRMAEQLGATCSTELDTSVTHVVSTDAGTDKSHWAVSRKKFLVSPGWIEASNYFWRKQPEEKFPVNQGKISDAPEKFPINQGKISDAPEKFPVNQGKISDAPEKFPVNQGKISDDPAIQE